VTNPTDGWTFDWRGWVIPAALLVTAQILGAFAIINSENLASPSEIAVEFYKAILDGELFGATYQTVLTSVGGLLIGGLIGTLIGIVCGLNRIADRLFQFPIEALRPIPSIALLPIGLLIFGFGYRMEIAIVAFAAIWPMLILTRAAVVAIEPRLMEVARILNFGIWQKVTKFILPAVLPRLFVALRLTTGIALIVSVTVEVTANPLGLGYGMLSAQQSLRPALSLAFLLWIGVVGWALNALLEHVQHRLFTPGTGRGE
jgi:ABC-type nitrate/sulfonate/bicarbonate transport system permease component